MFNSVRRGRYVAGIVIGLLVCAVTILSFTVSAVAAGGGARPRCGFMSGRELLTAVDGGDLAAVRALLAGGADVNEACRNGQTALMLAECSGQFV